MVIPHLSFVHPARLGGIRVPRHLDGQALGGAHVRLRPPQWPACLLAVARIVPPYLRVMCPWNAKCFSRKGSPIGLPRNNGASVVLGDALRLQVPAVLAHDVADLDPHLLLVVLNLALLALLALEQDCQNVEISTAPQRHGEHREREREDEDEPSQFRGLHRPYLL